MILSVWFLKFLNSGENSKTLDWIEWVAGTKNFLKFPGDGDFDLNLSETFHEFDYPMSPILKDLNE